MPPDETRGWFALRIHRTLQRETVEVLNGQTCARGLVEFIITGLENDLSSVDGECSSDGRTDAWNVVLPVIRNRSEIPDTNDVGSRGRGFRFLLGRLSRPGRMQHHERHQEARR